ncbi:hypothetical protein NQ314_012559 [Rhamnusium bicolor]|uniref:Uncharacterized protein n=1 Tax=Rhamnusium bicolor TaxID=1586634 RepID=A0AAV8XAI7_9CUCU|nr:hypothetical protein NQ314_012559 [Rhamnusium bicolor]
MSCEVLNKIGTGDCETNLLCKSDPNFAKLVASELVAEILESALDIVEDCEKEKSTKVVGDILENLANKFQEMNISEENKDLIASLSEKDECSLPLKGLGDQLKADGEIITEEASVRHPPVEKKNRLTDLVKNSKHVLAKLILNENKEAKFGPKNEKLIRVVELDSGDQPFKTRKKVLPENVPLPRNDSEEILEEPKENDVMDEIQLFGSSEKNGSQEEDDYKKRMTFPLAGGSGKTLSIGARCRTLKFPGELNAKKWNIGSKIINYIRKHHKKEDKSKEIDGVEFQPSKNE